MAEALGTAYVDIKPRADGFGGEAEKQIKKELGEPMDRLDKEVGGKLKDTIKEIGVEMAATKLVETFKGAMQAAGDLGEQTSKVGTVFKGAADRVMEFGDNATESIGASKLEALTAAGTFGNLLTSVGLTTDAAADMSIEMVTLAGDLASFNNVPVQAALDAIKSGLVGESEPLKAFGVNINEARIKTEAMALGLLDANGKLSDQNKVMVINSIILKDTTDAQGDFARTGDSAANQQKKFTAELENAKGVLGQALLPALQSFITIGRDLIPTVGALVGSVGQLAAGAATALAPVADLLGAIAGSHFGPLITGAGIAVVTLSAGVVPAIEGVQKAYKTLDTMMKAGSLFGPQAIAMVAFTVAAGAFLAVTSANAATEKQAKENLEEYTKAMEEAKDPAVVLAGDLEKLATQIAKTAQDTEEAEEGIVAVGDAWVTAKLRTSETQDVFNRAGITVGDLSNALEHGGEAMTALQDKLRKNIYVMEGNYAGWTKAKTAVSELEVAHTSYIVKQNESIEASLRSIIGNKGLEESWLADQEALHKLADGTVDYIAIGEVAKEVIAETGVVLTDAEAEALGAAAATDQYARATAELVGGLTVAAGSQLVIDAAMKQSKGTTEDLTGKAAELAAQFGLTFEEGYKAAQAMSDIEEAEKELKEATDAVADAYDKAKDEQDRWMGVAFGAQENLDNLTDATDALSASLVENGNTFAFATDSVEFNSVAARNNRDALREVVEAIGPVIEALQLAAPTADAAAEATRLFAEEQYNEAIASGKSEEAAGALRDAIIATPTAHTTDMDVAITNEAATRAARDALQEPMFTTLTVDLRTTGFAGLTPAEIQHMLATGGGQSVATSAAASGAFVTKTPGGSLLWVGEGDKDEAVVPLTSQLLRGLDAISAMAADGSGFGRGGGEVTVVVNIDGTPRDGGDAARLGKIAGSAAAAVLMERRLATAMRVG